MNNPNTISVIGLGYVGIPLLKELSNHYKMIGVDYNKEKIEDIRNNRIDFEDCEFIKKNKVKLYTDLLKAKKSDVYIICVPTPINSKNKPDLSSLNDVLKKISNVLKINDLIIFESTYYPGLTRKLARKYLEKDNFKINNEFFIGYSPERINPGDRVNTLKNTFKLLACSDLKYLSKMELIYQKICNNIHLCKSIEIAEMSKIIENVQRDINIAFINEILTICNKLNIPFNDVHKAASTKWNFLNFYPGLVGGHCISVDTYYLKYLCDKKKINTKIIDSGRSLNEEMIYFFKSKIDKIFYNKNKIINILFLGYSFKENVSDLRNSKNLELISLFLKDDKYNIIKFDPLVEKQSLKNFLDKLQIKFDCIFLLVPHDIIKNHDFTNYLKLLNKNGFIFDFKNIFDHKKSNKIISI